MRRRLLAPLILAAVLGLGLVTGGCGSKTVTTTGASGVATTTTVPKVHFARTKFLLHTGLALGSAGRYILKPYRAGAFKQGAPGRRRALAKAAAAGAFAVNELRLARNAALSDDTLRPLAAKLVGVSGLASGLLPSLATGSLDPLKLAGLGASAAGVLTLAKKLGAPVTEQVPPTLGG